jgi:gliding motility-associated transport system ATP-binding protein
MAAATLEGLSKRYGGHVAVDGVSFDVGEREVVGLLGPNGSGKTTILRLLTGYLRPSAGTARIAGFDVVDDGRAARGRVGYVPEDVPLYPHMRVTEYLEFMGRLRDLNGAPLRRAVMVACERLDLGDVRDTIIGRLSRGFRQRVSLAQAVLHEPQLLVLDEPTNGLDPRQIIELRALIRGLAESCAVLVTSHILGEIERIADRAAILVRGRLLAVEPLRKGREFRIRARPDMAPLVAEILAASPETSGGVDEVPDGEFFSWRVRLPDPDAAERVGVRLIAAGVAVAELCDAGSDLEKIFLAHTSGKDAA